MKYQALQDSIRLYLNDHQYEEGLSKWKLVQVAIEKLSPDELQIHIAQSHEFSKHFLATNHSPKADEIYALLKNACLKLNEFGLIDQMRFYQTVARSKSITGIAMGM